MAQASLIPALEKRKPEDPAWTPRGLVSRNKESEYRVCRMGLIGLPTLASCLCSTRVTCGAGSRYLSRWHFKTYLSERLSELLLEERLSGRLCVSACKWLSLSCSAVCVACFLFPSKVYVEMSHRTFLSAGHPPHCLSLKLGFTRQTPHVDPCFSSLSPH